MLTAEGCRARQKRLWSALGRDANCIMIGEPRHLTYLANFYPSPFSFASQNCFAILILAANGSSTLIVDNLQRRFAETAHADNVVVAEWYNGRESAAARANSVYAAVRDAIRGCGYNRIRADNGVSYDLIQRLSYRKPHPEVIGVGGLLHQLARTKDSDELEIIRKSIRAMEAGYAAARTGIHAGMTELEAFKIVHNAALESAGNPVQLYGDFASGPRAESGGGPPTGRVIEKGELIMIDYSVVIHGYRGDLCSTFVVDGKPSDRQQQMADCCLNAMRAGEGTLQAGTSCREVDSTVRSVFQKHDLGDYFKHHAGHGIGLGHPDPPYIVPESSDTLMTGDVVTLEPGCYIPGVGGMRFEHNYLITDCGFECLSNHHLGL